MPVLGVRVLAPRLAGLSQRVTVIKRTRVCLSSVSLFSCLALPAMGALGSSIINEVVQILSLQYSSSRKQIIVVIMIIKQYECARKW